jgi:hypothetical protein
MQSVGHNQCLRKLPNRDLDQGHVTSITWISACVVGIRVHGKLNGLWKDRTFAFMSRCSCFRGPALLGIGITRNVGLIGRAPCGELRLVEQFSQALGEYQSSFFVLGLLARS